MRGVTIQLAYEWVAESRGEQKCVIMYNEQRERETDRQTERQRERDITRRENLLTVRCTE